MISAVITSLFPSTPPTTGRNQAPARAANRPPSQGNSQRMIDPQQPFQMPPPDEESIQTLVVRSEYRTLSSG
jgi:hypothetical protein